MKKDWRLYFLIGMFVLYFLLEESIEPRQYHVHTENYEIPLGFGSGAIISSGTTTYSGSITFTR